VRRLGRSLPVELSGGDNRRPDLYSSTLFCGLTGCSAGGSDFHVAMPPASLSTLGYWELRVPYLKSSKRVGRPKGRFGFAHVDVTSPQRDSAETATVPARLSGWGGLAVPPTEYDRRISWWVFPVERPTRPSPNPFSVDSLPGPRPVFHCVCRLRPALQLRTVASQGLVLAVYRPATMTTPDVCRELTPRPDHVISVTHLAVPSTSPGPGVRRRAGGFPIAG